MYNESAARAITQGPLFHWFGYYDMPCWDPSGQAVLSLGVDFEMRPPAASDQATIGLSNTTAGAYRVVGRTSAFNWQQGAMLHWLPERLGATIIYNDRQAEQFVSVLLDVESGERRLLGRATSDVGIGARYALALNFSRVADMRPGYGYAGLRDHGRDALHPADDGVWTVDLATGQDQLAVSMNDVFEYLGRPAELESAKMWFNHTLLNPSETRFVFLVRWPVARSWKTLMFCANTDGSDLRLVLKDGMVSHFDWRDDDWVLAWTRIDDEGDHFYLINVNTGEHQVIGAPFLNRDGHCSFSHNSEWILTDTYPEPETYLRTLKIYRIREQDEIVVGRYLSPPPFVGEIRCDLHPRWSRDDRQVCFDSVHEGHRQVYVIETPSCLLPQTAQDVP